MALISLDISGAFDSVEWNDVLALMKDKELPGVYGKIVANYFRDRVIYHQGLCGRVKRQVWRGCPQGSVLGPFFWTLVMNQLLDSFPEASAYKAIAYADDLMIAVNGRNREDIEINASFLIPMVQKWSKEYGMVINTQKSELLYLTKKHKTNSPIIKMNNNYIPGKQVIKYLGIYFDKNLNFNYHVKAQNNKARRLLHNLSGFARQTWGLKSKYLEVLYKGVLEPIML